MLDNNDKINKTQEMSDRPSEFSDSVGRQQPGFEEQPLTGGDHADMTTEQFMESRNNML